MNILESLITERARKEIAISLLYKIRDGKYKGGDLEGIAQDCIQMLAPMGCVSTLHEYINSQVSKEVKRLGAKI